MNDSSSNRVTKLLKNASLLLGANTLASALGFGQAIVIGRALGVDGYGLLGVVIVFTTVVNQIFDVRLWETVTKYVDEFHARGDDRLARATVKLGFGVDAATGVVAFGIVVAIAPWASGALLHRPEAAPLITIFALTLLVATLNQTATALLRVFDRFAWLGTERAVFAAVRLAVLGGTAYLTRDLTAVLWGYVATDLARAIVLISVAVRTARRELSGDGGPSTVRDLRPYLRELATFTGHNAVMMVLSLISRQLDVLILARFRDDTDVGYYRMARNFVMLLLRLSDPVYQAIFPEMVKLREERSMAEVKAFIRDAMLRVLAIVVPVAAGLALLAPWLIQLTVGAAFLPSAVAVRIMVVGVLVHATMLWARPLALTAGKPVVSTVAFGAGALVLVVASVFLVPTYGYVGSAIVFLLTMSTTAGLSAIGALRYAR